MTTRSKPTGPPLSLARTLSAVEAYDAHDELVAKVLLFPEDYSDSAADQIMRKRDELGAIVGTAYGLDTADRNDPATCARCVRPGPRMPQPGAELSFVRRMLALYCNYG